MPGCDGMGHAARIRHGQRTPEHSDQEERVCITGCNELAVNLPVLSDDSCDTQMYLPEKRWHAASDRSFRQIEQCLTRISASRLTRDPGSGLEGTLACWGKEGHVRDS